MKLNYSKQYTISLIIQISSFIDIKKEILRPPSEIKIMKNT